MSRDYIAHPTEDAAFSLRDIRDSLADIASVLDDYLELTLTAQHMNAVLSAASPESAAAFKPLFDAMERIRERRTNR